MKTKLVRLFAALCLVLGLLVTFPATPARAASLTVTNCNDSGAGSLRQVVADATDGSHIDFGLDCPAAGPLTLASPITIEQNITISGAGHEIVISGNNAVKIFFINYDYTVGLEYLTLKNGRNNDGGNGGAIYDNGSFLTLSHVILEGNQASGDSSRDGGALYHGPHGSLTVLNSTFANNSATRSGGAIETRVATTITDSTFTGNNARRGGAVDSYAGLTLSLERVTMNANTASGPGGATGQGGAIYFSGTLNIDNSTLSGNGSSSSTTYGGAIYTYDSTVTIRNSTIVNNNLSNADPSFSGGGIHIYNATLNYYNTILAGNEVDDCATTGGLTVAHNLNNLVGVSVGCGTPAIHSDPNLGLLASNGGATQTHALLPGSPALNAGDNATCLATDQRGQARPQGSACDIGAYEVQYRYVATSGSNASNDCTDSAAPCQTVAYAIGQAGAGDAIHLAAGTYTQNLSVSKDLTFIGDGMNQTFLDGGGAGKVVALSPNPNVSMADLTIQNGLASSDEGGGIYISVGSTLNLKRVRVINNQASLGGGIISYGTLIMTDSEVSGNTASRIGGGLFLTAGANSTLTNVTIRANTSVKYGGGFHQQGTGILNLTNTTISGNSAGEAGGGAFTIGGSSTVNILNSTIANNNYNDPSITDGIGGILNNATLNLKNSIVSGNEKTNCANYGTLTSQGYNLEDTHTCGFSNTGDLADTDPLLGPLADYGGPTWSMALLTGSPAIDAGTNSGCPATDQRGIVRPQGLHCDIGAFEFSNRTPTDLSLSSSSVAGNRLAGTLVGAFTTTDPDAGDTFTYTLAAGAGSTDNASFSILGDQLLTAAVFNPAVKSSYSIRVRTADQDGAWYEKPFTITVTANNYTPILVSPDTGVDLLNNRPVFDWLDVPGVTSYTLQIGKDSAFTLLAGAYTVTQSTYTPAADLPANLPLWWRVKINKSGVPNPWSEVRTLTSAFPPSVPVLVAPANNALTANYNPLLDWNNVTVPAGAPAFLNYRVQIDDNADFSSLAVEVFVVGMANSSYLVGSHLPDNTKYYWRVSSYNIDGEYSAWSLVRYFRTPLLAPTLGTPLDEADLPNKRPTFDWSDVFGATGYTLQVSKNDTFTSLAGTYSATTSTYIHTADLAANTKYWWRVQSKGANGPSAWSAIRWFTTGNPPTVPTLVAPASNALIASYRPLLDWSNVTVPAGTFFGHYRIQVDDNADFSSPVIDETVAAPATNSSYTPGADLGSNTKYYWRVSAYNTDGETSAWSLVRYFRTLLLPPALNNPADGADVPNKRPTLNWSVVAGATGYAVQISKNDAFTQLVGTYNTTPTTYTHTADLLADTTYYWRVQSKGLNGPSLWSGYRSFRTANPPGIPVLVAPAVNALTTNYRPLFDWSDASMPTVPPGAPAFDYYLLQADDNADFSSLFFEASVSGGITHSSYTPGFDLPSNSKLYWRVRSYNVDGDYSAWSLVRYFRTAIAPPTLLLPANGGPAATRKPAFDWADRAGATGYTIQISKNDTFTSLVGTYNVTASAYTPAVNLPTGTLYWRVLAKGPNGPSDWSEKWSLLIP